MCAEATGHCMEKPRQDCWLRRISQFQQDTPGICARLWHFVHGTAVVFFDVASVEIACQHRADGCGISKAAHTVLAVPNMSCRQYDL